MKKLIYIAVVAIVAMALFQAFRQNDAASPEDASASAAVTPAEKGLLPFFHYDDLEVADCDPSLPSIRKSYKGFTLSFNPSNHTPNWVGWELLASETVGSESRSNNFWQDESLDGCPSTDDYKHSGYDRGHLCPAADQKWSPQAMSDCFVLANIAPQDNSLNRGAWQTLEKKERLWAQRDSAIVIVAGLIYQSSDTKRIGATGVRVPSAFFKVIAAPYLKEPRAIGFIYPNMSAPGNMQDYSMTVDEVEKETGLDFFSNLPDDIENKIESTVSFKEWNRR